MVHKFLNQLVFVYQIKKPIGLKKKNKMKIKFYIS